MISNLKKEKNKGFPQDLSHPSNKMKNSSQNKYIFWLILKFWTSDLRTEKPRAVDEWLYCGSDILLLLK